MPEPKWSGRNPTPDGGNGGSSTLSGLTDVTGPPNPGTAPVYDDSGVAPLTPVTTHEDLEQVLAQVAAVEWIEPTLQSGFNNIGDPWAPCRYRITQASTVFVEGTVRNPDTTIADATWIPIFELPDNARPTAALEFDVLTNEDAISKIAVFPDGTVVWLGYKLGAHTTIDRLPLNGINFSLG